MLWVSGRFAEYSRSGNSSRVLKLWEAGSLYENEASFTRLLKILSERILFFVRLNGVRIIAIGSSQPLPMLGA